MYRQAVLPAMRGVTRILGKDDEFIHERAISLLRFFGNTPLADLLKHYTCVSGNERTICGIRFPNPVGLAAGFDKNAAALRGIAAFGFGFIECGTVVPKAQPGNPRPRLFRLDPDRAIINRMGFNSPGAEVVRANLAAMWQPLGIPIGINIGKNKDTPDTPDEVIADYVSGVEMFYDFADYLACNVSSPNTPGLRALQAAEPLTQIIRACKAAIVRRAGNTQPKPLFVKIAPDLDHNGLDAVLTAIEAGQADGIIACNTTTERHASLTSPRRTETGGLSGTRETHLRVVDHIAYLKRHLPGTPVIGVHGIMEVDDAKRVFGAGASLIQIYTGWIFDPWLPHRINKALRRLA